MPALDRSLPYWLQGGQHSSGSGGVPDFHASLGRRLGSLGSACGRDLQQPPSMDVMKPTLLAIQARQKQVTVLVKAMKAIQDAVARGRHQGCVWHGPGERHM